MPKRAIKSSDNQRTQCQGLSSTKRSKLSRNITVIRLGTDENGKRGGGISELPKDAKLDLCGEGFNERTVKVRWHGKLFFAFLQDLDSPAGAY